MIFFDRNPNAHPPALNHPAIKDDEAEIDRFLNLPQSERLQTDSPESPHVPKSVLNDLIRELSNASLGKCAFCERKNQNLFVHRFRPDGNPVPLQKNTKRHHYLWLRWEWANMFPICTGCTPADGHDFPVLEERRPAIPKQHRRKPDQPWAVYSKSFSKELPLIIQPETKFHSFYREFLFDPSGRLIGITKQAQETIRRYSLNRSELLEGRQGSLIAKLEELKQSIERFEVPFILDKDNGKIAWHSVTNGIEKMEYAGFWLLHMRSVCKQADLAFGSQHKFNDGFFDGAMSSWIRKDKLKLAAIVDTVLDAAKNAYQSNSDSKNTTSQDAEGDQEHVATLDNLESISVRNYKSLEHIDITLPRHQSITSDLERERNAPCLLLLGENSTGKSSLLEAIALAGINDLEREQLHLNYADYILSPSNMGSKNTSKPTNATVTLTFESKESRSIKISDNSVDGDSADLLLPKLFAYGSHRVFGSLLTEPTFSSSSKVRTLFNDDEKLPNPEEWIADVAQGDDSTLDELVSALRYVIQIDGEFSHIEVKSERKGESSSRCYIVLKKRKVNGDYYDVRYPLDQVSSGYRTVIGILCDVFDGLMTGGKSAFNARHSPAIVLIDEIESHLHPRWKISLVSGLRKAFPSIIFIMTTHDALCLRGMKSGEVVVLNRVQHGWHSEESEYPELVVAESNLPDPSRLTVEQLLASDLFKMYSASDPVTELELAEAADYLASPDKSPGIPTKYRNAITYIDTEITAALPVGSSEIRQMVQEAIVEYLQQRRDTASSEVSALRTKARQKIVEALRRKGINDEAG